MYKAKEFYINDRKTGRGGLGTTKPEPTQSLNPGLNFEIHTLSDPTNQLPIPNPDRSRSGWVSI